MDESSWTCEEVGAWLRDIGYEKYVEFFADNQMDGRALSQLTTNELFYLVKCFSDTFKLGDILKFQEFLAPFQKRKIPPEIGTAPTGRDTNRQMFDQPNFQMADQPNRQMADQPNYQMADQPNQQMADQPNYQSTDQASHQVTDQAIIDESDQINESFEDDFAVAASMSEIEQNDNWHTFKDIGDVVVQGDGDDTGSTITPSSTDEINRSAEIMAPISVEIPPTEQPPSVKDENLASETANDVSSETASQYSNNPSIPMGRQSPKTPKEEFPAASAVQTTATMGDGPKIESEKFQSSTPISPTEDQGPTTPPKPIQTADSAFGGTINVSGATVTTKPPVRVSVAASYHPDLTRRGLDFRNPAYYPRWPQATASPKPQCATGHLPSPISASKSLPSPQGGMTSAQVSPQVVPTPTPQSAPKPSASSSTGITTGPAPIPSSQFNKTSYIYRYLVNANSLPAVGRLFRAYVSYSESPLELSVLEEKSQTRVTKLGANLNNFYDKSPYVLPLPPEMIKVGTACVAKFEGSWYRASITKVLNDDKVQVRYVDYGNRETLPRSALKALKRDKFTDVPIQRIDLRLDGIPLNQPISSEQRDDFYDMVDPLRKLFLVKIDSYVGGPPYVAQMMDTVANTSLNVDVQDYLGIPTRNVTEVEPLKENKNPGGMADAMDDAFWNKAGPYGAEDEDDY